MVDRLRRAGATEQEISQIELTTQLVARLDELSDYDIREWLQKLRDAGYFR